MAEVKSIDTDNLDDLVLIAKALRECFWRGTDKLRNDTWMTDDYIVEVARTIQAQNEMYDRITAEIRIRDRKLYNIAILGRDTDD